eukprot:scaffold150032_cov15-Prasinocladus_malaysianus.AAC.1
MGIAHRQRPPGHSSPSKPSENVDSLHSIEFARRVLLSDVDKSRRWTHRTPRLPAVLQHAGPTAHGIYHVAATA